MKSHLATSLRVTTIVGGGLLAAVLLIGITGGAANAAQCATCNRSWVFQQSYYSHDPVSHVRIGRQFAPGPVYSRPVGEYFNAGYRNLRSTIRVGRETHDHLNVWESWYQVGAQF